MLSGRSVLIRTFLILIASDQSVVDTIYSSPHMSILGAHGVLVRRLIIFSMHVLLGYESLGSGNYYDYIVIIFAIIIIDFFF